MPTGELNNAEHLDLTPRANSISSLQSLLSDFTETISTSTGDVMTLLQLQQQQNAAEPTVSPSFEVQQAQFVNRRVQPVILIKKRDKIRRTKLSCDTFTGRSSSHFPLTAGSFKFFFDEDGLLRPGADVRVNGSAPTRAKVAMRRPSTAARPNLGGYTDRQLTCAGAAATSAFPCILDVMSCGFGAVVLVFLIMNHESQQSQEVINKDLLAEKCACSTTSTARRGRSIRTV